MSYQITITADSVAELAGRLLAMGAQLARPAPAASPTVIAQPEPVVLADEVVFEPEIYRDEVLYVSPSKAPEPEVAPEPEPEAEPEVVLNYDKDVSPKVLALVKARGREVAMKLLEEYGVQRASQMPAKQWPELLFRISLLMKG